MFKFRWVRKGGESYDEALQDSLIFLKLSKAGVFNIDGRKGSGELFRNQRIKERRI
jgi:hypothetical protein